MLPIELKPLAACTMPIAPTMTAQKINPATRVAESEAAPPQGCVGERLSPSRHC